MYYLIYLSRAVKAMSEEDLVQLLFSAREVNEKLDVSGVLLYKNPYFLQLLEGDRAVVENLYAKIQKDSRHSNFVIVDSGEIEKRLCPDWSMGFNHFSFLKKFNFDGLNENFSPKNWSDSKILGENSVIEIFKNFSSHESPAAMNP